MSVLFGMDTLLLEGVMPERALLRLRRNGITVYNAKKKQKNQILFRVKRKDSEKVFAIYPNVCYNDCVYTPYVVKKLPPTGLARGWDWLRKRVGLVLGGLLFLAVVTSSERLVFEITFAGTDVYAREVKTLLEQEGIKPFAPYVAGKEDVLCAQLLALDGVEFCSIKKIGKRVVVEMRTSPFMQTQTDRNCMFSKSRGEILDMVVLRGTPVKRVGEQVQPGEMLVGNWLEDEQGGQVRVEIIARVRLACVWEGVVQATTEEEAFAKGYLEGEFSSLDTLTSVECTPQEEGYYVKIAYERIEKINL